MRYRIRHIDKWGAAEHHPMLSRSERMWLFAERHRGGVMAGLLVACLAAGLLGALLWNQHQREQEAADLAEQAMQAYMERSDDGEAAAESMETAARMCRDILERFPRTPGAQLAGYLLGNILAEQQDYAGAIDAYQQFLEREGSNPVLLGLVYQRLGAAYLEHGEREKGLRAYARALDVPDALNQDQVLFELATIEEHANRTDLALEYYKRLGSDHPTSPFAGEAAFRVKNLEPEPSVEDSGDAEPKADAQPGDETQSKDANEE